MINRTKIISSVTILSAVLVAAFFSVSHSRVCTGLKNNKETTDENIDSSVLMLNRRISNSSCESISLIDSKINSYMQRWDMKGAALAVMRNDSLVYAKGYGKADETRDMEPCMIMRMASVSKLITAAAIMKLKEEGALELTDTVFGANGILNSELYLKAIGNKRYFSSITVEHLLRHQAGFYRDPLFGMQNLMKETGSSTALSHDQTIQLGLRGNLRFEPGTWQRYSNLGYLLLGDIIEKCSGKKYEDYVIENIMRPAGCFDFHIGGSWKEDRRANEVYHYTHEGDGKYIQDIRDTCRMTERSYGGNDIKLLGSAGGWTGSVVELARFIASIDGRDEVRDILSQESVAEMTEYFDENTYALGWNDSNPSKGWTRTGTLSGTNAIIRYFPDGECWIFISNTSTYKGPGQAKFTDRLFNEIREQCRGMLPDTDLFDQNYS